MDKFDFFNQSIVKPRIVPSEAEKKFLLGKAELLDPQGNQRIHGKHALAILSHAQVSNDKIKAIWMISNEKNNEYLSFEDMYVAFRLVSYAQNGIQLSKENVEANIKCPLPNLTDSNDENQELGKSPPTLPPMKRSPSKVSQYFTVSEVSAFEDSWNKINKNGYLISGSDVRNMFQSSREKAELSKIWRLCCHTVKGSLTKGEFFVFKQVIRMSGEGVQIPDTLSTEMHEAISKIDTEIRNNSALIRKSVLAQRPNSNKILKLQAKIKQNQEPIKQIRQQLSAIQAKETEFGGVLGQFESYLSACQKNTQFLASEIEKIKSVQSESITRLNTDLNRMKEVIERQNTLILKLTTSSGNGVDHLNHMPSKKHLGPPVEHDAVSRFSAKSMESQASNPNDLYPYQLQTIKLLHAVTPFSPQQLPGIQKRIQSMGVNQLKAYFQQLKQRYQQQQSILSHQNEAEGNESANVTGIQEETSQQVHPSKDQSMFVKKDKDALDTIENIFGNLNLDQSSPDADRPTEDFFA